MNYIELLSVPCFDRMHLLFALYLFRDVLDGDDILTVTSCVGLWASGRFPVTLKCRLLFLAF